MCSEFNTPFHPSYPIRKRASRNSPNEKCFWTTKDMWTDIHCNYGHLLMDRKGFWDMQIDEMDICSWTDQHFAACSSTHPGCSVSPSSIHKLITHPELQIETRRRMWIGKHLDAPQSGAGEFFPSPHNQSCIKVNTA
ncbi:hypothetical protein Q8A67_012809 [Cirrhinus molitorella]|uniref:Uncharacterized protein n=1 Tax=Cirrhinus molitorella TaxID=172907 RepID=A0AA88PK35_9TELE|nr:hypothetical protein Q8A67_012809 [Cirrhinus molitorella]